MIYTVIGTGAIGGYYGAKLAFSGNEVHFLLHSDYEYVKANGLYLSAMRKRPLFNRRYTKIRRSDCGFEVSKQRSPKNVVATHIKRRYHSVANTKRNRC